MGRRRARGETGRTCLDGHVDDPAHLLQLGPGGGTLVGIVAHHEQAHRGVTDIAAVVQADSVALHRIEVVGERLEAIPRHTRLEGVEAHVLDVLQRAGDQLDAGRPLDRRDGEAAVAGNHRRDTVERGGREIGVPEDLGVVVGVDVDEAGGDHVTRSVELALSTDGVVDRDDPSARYTDIGHESGPTGAVDDRPPANRQISRRVRHRIPPSCVNSPDPSSERRASRIAP